MEAVDRFLSETQDFVIDKRCERFMMTLNPRGYLRRVAKHDGSGTCPSRRCSNREAVEAQGLRRGGGLQHPP
jgi:hypothetical protein